MGTEAVLVYFSKCPLCSAEERNAYRFVTTYKSEFSFGWTILFIVKILQWDSN